MSPESPSKASSGSTQTSNSGGESTVDVEAIVRRLHDGHYTRCDWQYSNPCDYRCTYADDVRAAVNATLAALPPEGEVERLRAEVEAWQGKYMAQRALKEDAQAEVSQLRARVAELEKRARPGISGYLDELESQLAASQAALRLISAIPAFPSKDIADKALGPGETWEPKAKAEWEAKRAALQSLPERPAGGES